MKRTGVEYIIYLYYMFKKGKNIKINYSFLNSNENVKFKKITKRYCYDDGIERRDREEQYCSYAVKDKIMIDDLFFEYIEKNEKIKEILVQKINIHKSKFIYAERVIVGIITNLKILKRKNGVAYVEPILNNYLIFIKKKLKKHKYKNLYNENLINIYFVQQTADIEENWNGIKGVEYGNVVREKNRIWGLKVKGTRYLLSEIVLLYKSKDIYSIIIEEVKKDKNIELTEEDCESVLDMIYILLKEFEYIEKISY